MRLLSGIEEDSGGSDELRSPLFLLAPMRRSCYHVAMLSKEDMIDFVGDSSTPEKEIEIRNELSDPNSFASRFIKEWRQKARNALNVDWKRLAGLEIANDRETKEKETNS